ncbi:MAG: hypothetical protein WBA51_11690 [Erythrobacter sp.]
MDTATLYDTFRLQHPDLAAATDRRHAAFWETGKTGVSYLWFESLANELNAWMRDGEKHAAIGAAFKYLDQAFRRGDAEVRDWIDVGLVENLFWQVPAKHAGPVWPLLPPSLQQLYIAFHHHLPEMEA